MEYSDIILPSEFSILVTMDSWPTKMVLSAHLRLQGLQLIQCPGGEILEIGSERYEKKTCLRTSIIDI